MNTAFAKPEALAPETVPVERLTFGWWNTSLSPVGKDRSDEDHKQIAAQIVKGLMDGLGIDCLALGEVTKNDLDFFKGSCERPGLTVYDGTLKAGRLQFDTGLIYDSARLTIDHEESLTSSHGGRNVKLANRIHFISNSDGSLFHVFVSHWPSRGVREENILTREAIAVRLKDTIDEIKDASSNARIILLGDFNDEPFDKSLSWNLLATRDRNLAKTKTGYLYNPFWRQLGESNPHSLSSSKNGMAGSCFYRGATDTHWRTFDQILFSPAFLGNGDWHLNERKTFILETEYLVELVQNEQVSFDHLPVLSVVEKQIKGD